MSGNDDRVYSDREVALVLKRASELEGERSPGGSGGGLTLAQLEEIAREAGLDALRRLIEVVDQQVPEDGIVTEALGTVRWTGRGKLRSTQVSVGPSGDRTRIQVTRRFREQIRPMLHLIPGVWGLVGGMGVAAGLGFSGGLVAGVAAGGTLLGAGIGRTIWHILSAGSAREVKRLVRELSQRIRTDS